MLASNVATVLATAGHVAGAWYLAVAAAEVVVGLGIIVSIFRRKKIGATADSANLLKG